MDKFQKLIGLNGVIFDILYIVPAKMSHFALENWPKKP